MCEIDIFVQRNLRRWLMTLALVLLLLVALRVSASVGLIRFQVVPQSGGFLSVQWETASETNTVSFRLYRALEQWPLDSANWGAPIHEEGATGDLIGAAYVYSDTNVIAGVRYWYMLEEVTGSGGSARLQVTSGGLDLPPDTSSTPTLTSTSTPTTAGGVTPTFTATTTRTPTPQPGGGQPAATATQRFTNTPPPPPPLLPTPGAGTSFQPTATPLPPASVATPTGSVPVATLFAPAVSPTPLPTETPAPPEAVATATPTPTAIVIAAQPSAAATKTPQVFEATSISATPLPAATPETKARNTGRLLLLGGGAIALAAALAIVAVFAVRARR